MNSYHTALRSRLARALRGIGLLAVTSAALAQQGARGPLAVTGITPAGDNVPAGRQIVVQFNRPVVPIGRMDRRPEEIPIVIEPPLPCEWRWLDTSALACELGDGDALRLATRYRLTVQPGIAAQDGAVLAGEYRHDFVTERPRVLFPSFATWLAPGTPVVRVVFSQSVSESSVREHLYMRHGSAARVSLEAEPDPEQRELPRFARLPGESIFVDFGERERRGVDDRPVAAAGETARRVWLVRPRAELPLDAPVELVVEPGLEGAEGTERGDETRVIAAFHTFPEFAFLGVECTSLAGQPLTIATTSGLGACNPMASVGLRFSAPVLPSEIKEQVEIVPDLAGGRADYDPWANWRDYSALAQPHERGRVYVVWLPERLKAAERYRLAARGTGTGPRDEFGRALVMPLELAFETSHRPPDYTLVHTTAVLEQGVDSEVPLYVQNLARYRLDYRSLTPEGARSGLVRERDLPAVEDVQFGVPLDVRELLGGRSGAIYGRLASVPAVRKSSFEDSVFAAVTPYQLHVKLGHFNTLVWVTSLATGEPVDAASVAVYVDRLSRLAAGVVPLATAATDGRGIAALPGTRLLDPKLDLLGYGCGGTLTDDCPRLFVRVDGAEGMALLPLEYRFEVDSYRVSNYTVFARGQPENGHLHAWGTTAQGVYRAGDTLEYKIYVRDQDNESLVPPPPGPYRLEIVDPTGQVVHTVADAMLSKFGGFDGTFAIPRTAAVGWYGFRLTALGREELVRMPLRVLVSDFTPSTFGVSAALNGDLFGAGDEVTATARATLFSGGPYVDAEARFTAQVVAKPFRSEHPLAAGFAFDTGTELPPAFVVAQHVARVDAQGEAAHTFVLPADLGNRVVHGSVTVEGAVRDDRGKYVAAAAGAVFVAVDRLVGLRASDWVFQEDRPATVQYIVVDARGVPSAGTAVTVSVERLETKAARVRGAGTAYLTEFVDEWLAVDECRGTSTPSPLDCVFTPSEPGSYRLTATIRDTRDRPHTTVLRTWVVGAGQLVWRSGNDDALELVPERVSYAVGDTARYLVKNPYPGARALVTIERYGVLAQWVETLESSTPVIEFEVDKDYLPGFYLSVLVMSPRVAGPPPAVGELDLGKPAFKLGYVEVPVVDPYKTIDVNVTTSAAVAKPGDRVRVRVRARAREREQREPIEVAVAVLDEAVLDLIQGGTSYFDPYAGFYTQDGLDVRNFSLLTRLVGRQQIERKGANPGGDGGAAFSMRSAFKYVSYWNPSLELDSRGNGSFEFEVPDNLTGWRVLVMAATPSDRLGLGQASFKVNRPTEVRPVMPNQVTEGDRFEASFSVMNRTDGARDVRVTVAAAEGLAVPLSHAETVHLEPYARATVKVPVVAARVPAERATSGGRIEFTVTARDATDGDGLKHSLPVRERRSLETAATYGTLSGDRAIESIAFPAGIETDVGGLGVVLSPSVVGNVDGAFRYLRDYPYACWEQRLTKGVMAAHFTGLRDYLPPDLVWSEAATLPEETLAAAASFQAPNGGMTYYVPQDQYVSPYLSAYTALAFAWLRADGLAIPEAVETKLLDYLDTFLKRDVAPDFYTRGMASTVRAVALAALAKRGRATLTDLRRYRSHVEYMSLFGKAHYLQAARAIEGADDVVREVEQILMQSAVESGGKLAFNEVLDDGYLRLSATPLNSSCAILSAISAGGASTLSGDVPFELVRAITQARGGRDHWENTQENAFCANALLDYARRYEQEAPAMRVAASVAGAALGTVEFGSVRDEAVTLVRPLAPSDPGTSAELAIERQGAGRLYYSARLQYAPTALAAEAVNAGIDVRREYSVERDGEWTLLGDAAQIRRGELVRVDIFVSLPTARHFVVVDDPVPGGLEPVNRDLANASLVDAEAGEFRAAGGSWWFQRGDWQGYGASRWSFYHRELRHDAVRFYSEYLPPGNFHLSYSAQAIAVGEFAVMPTHAEEMYDPDVYGKSAPGRLAVAEQAR